MTLTPDLLSALIVWIVIVGWFLVLGSNYFVRKVVREEDLRVREQGFKDMVNALDRKQREHEKYVRKQELEQGYSTGQIEALETYAVQRPVRYPVPSQPARTREDEIFYQTWIAPVDNFITDMNQELEEA